MTRLEDGFGSLPALQLRPVRRLIALIASVLIAFPLSAPADMVLTPKARPAEMEKALREARPGELERVELLLGPEGPRAGVFNTFLLQLIIYGGIVAVVMIVGIISIIAYGISKKGKDNERLAPLR